LSASKGIRSPSAIVVHFGVAGLPRICAALVALRSAVAAPALVKTPSLTPLEYSSGPATFSIE
jgi:hypothetical protein